MQNLITQILSTIIQLFLFSIPPFIWWKVTKSELPFFRWIGLKKIRSSSKKLVVYCIGTFIVFAIFVLFTNTLISDSSILANAKYNDWHITTIISVFLYAFIQTALAEEIFFRGFLAKRLINKLGFIKGNIIHAGVFGCIHGLLLLQFHQSFITIIGVVLITGAIGYIIAYINEKFAQGSIITSWLLHALTNFLSSLLIIANVI